MFVFLSTSDAPDLTFSQSDAISRGEASFVAKQESASSPLQSYSLWDTITSIWSKGVLARTLNNLVGGNTDATDDDPATPSAAAPVPTAKSWTGLTDGSATSSAALLWHARGLNLATGATSGGSLFTNVTLPRSVTERNQTLLAHIVMCRTDSSRSQGLPSRSKGGSSPPACLDDPEAHFRILYPIVLHKTKKAQARLRSLLDEHSLSGADAPSQPKQEAAFGIGLGSNSQAEDAQAASDLAGADAEAEIAAWEAGEELDVSPAAARRAAGDQTVPYWRPTLHVATVADQSGFQTGKLPPYVPNVIQVTSSGVGYTPFTVVNDWWLLSRRLIEVNETAQEVPLEVSWEGVSIMYWTVMTQWVSQTQMQADMGMQREGDSELIKQVILETNPWLLGLTFAVSTLHMVFDFLAFQADISFWRRAKTMEGLSIKTIFISVAVQLVILLYLFDNDTSWMILLSNVVGVAIEVWKLRKAVAVSIKWDGWVPSLDWADKDDGYVRSKTKQYDDEAISNLGALLFPLMVGYAMYSLFYAKHKSWYSWVLSSMVGFVYAFGFVLLVPQVYLNYKLRSVAHMPWKAMVYKTLNTVIDDIFAFVIPAPTMHRLATFRDDIIFVVYLYQRCVYPVDKKRINEFGMSGEDEQRALEKATGVKRACRRRKTDRHKFIAVPDKGTLAGRES